MTSPDGESAAASTSSPSAVAASLEGVGAGAPGMPEIR